MATQIDLHGAEVLYLADQAAPITIGPSSIVGLVGAATNAAAETSARLAIGRGNAALTFTAAAAGAAGNTIVLEIVRPNEASKALAITVDGRSVVVSLATDVDGEVTTTGILLLAAWAVVPAAPAIAASTLAAIAATGHLDRSRRGLAHRPHASRRRRGRALPRERADRGADRSCGCEARHRRLAS